MKMPKPVKALRRYVRTTTPRTRAPSIARISKKCLERMRELEELAERHPHIPTKQRLWDQIDGIKFVLGLLKEKP